MIMVIQCAARKNPDAGHLKTASGKPVLFVADPQAAPAKPAHVYARPDDPSDRGMSWRQLLANYNEHPEDNPFGLYPACQLYENRTYKRLTEQVGLHNLYILSACAFTNHAKPKRHSNSTYLGIKPPVGSPAKTDAPNPSNLKAESSQHFAPPKTCDA